MIINEDAICTICKKVFCCAKCCINHQVKKHAIFIQPRSPAMPTKTDEIYSANDKTKKKNYVFCAICEEKPFSLHKEMPGEVLEHIRKNHLPLRCRKCAKLYTNLDDLKQFSKCFGSPDPTALSNNLVCIPVDQMADTFILKNYLEAKNKNNISTQTSPMHKNKNFLGTPKTTPFSVIKFRWKTNNKFTHEELISDSVSSIKNLSSINNIDMRYSMGSAPKTNGNLVRSTSTPVQSEMMGLKPKEQAFNATNGQVSSIYNSGSEPETSPAICQPIGTPSKQLVNNANRFRKICTRPQILAVTPLRQVMSKSIQKALTEHGALQEASAIANNEEFGNSPLDLRLSPALRRIQNSSMHRHSTRRPTFSQKISLSEKKLTTESIVITRTKCLSQVNSKSSDKENYDDISVLNCDSTASGINGTQSKSIYRTCHSVKIITSTELSEVNITKNDDCFDNENCDGAYTERPTCPTNETSSGNNSHPVTPITSASGSVNKKLIYFEKTPLKVNSFSPGDVFYTPNSTLDENSIKSVTNSVKRKIIARRPAIKDISDHKHFQKIDDEVFRPKDASSEISQKHKEKESREKAGGLWSLMSSVMRFSSFSGTSSGNNDLKPGSLLKRCASIAGSIVRSKSTINEDKEELQTFKRKRTYTLDNPSENRAHKQNFDNFLDSNISKGVRIHGRQPIKRMRLEKK